MLYDVNVPIQIESAANLREHWTAKASRNKRQAAVVKWYLLAANVRVTPDEPLIITITRHGRKLDFDNLPYSLKAIIDAVADYCNPGLPPGRADALPRFTWNIQQAKKRPKPLADCGLNIKIETIQD